MIAVTSDHPLFFPPRMLLQPLLAPQGASLAQSTLQLQLWVRERPWLYGEGGSMLLPHHGLCHQPEM